MSKVRKKPYCPHLKGGKMIKCTPKMIVSNFIMYQASNNTETQPHLGVLLWKQWCGRIGWLSKENNLKIIIYKLKLNSFDPKMSQYTILYIKWV